MKDRTLSQGIKVAINQKINSYGEIQKLTLDTKRKCMDVEIMLKGESDCLFVHVEEYSIVEFDGAYQLKVSSVKTSREWLDEAVKTHVAGKVFIVPRKYAKIVKILM